MMCVVPNQPKTKARAVRIDDELWARVAKLADTDGTNYSTVIRDALEHYLEIREKP